MKEKYNFEIILKVYYDKIVIHFQNLFNLLSLFMRYYMGYIIGKNIIFIKRKTYPCYRG